MANIQDDDCGCDSGPVELKPEDVDAIKSRMTGTKQTLEEMLSKIEGMNLDLSHFNNMEEEITKVSKYLYSGEFVKSVEKIVEMSKNSSVAMAQPITNPLGFNFPFPENTSTKKEPIGYVWLDDNGEQKFSPIKPEDVVSMPVYGD